MKKLIFIPLLIIFYVSGIYAQSTADVCRETAKELEEKRNELNQVETSLTFKKQESRIRSILSDVRKAIAEKRIIQGLGDVARNYYFNAFYPADDHIKKLAFEKKFRLYLETELQKALNSNEKELESNSDQLREAIDLRQKRLNDLECELVLKRLNENLQGLIIPNVIKECEGGFCGTWTRNGDQFEAVWDNGAKATLTINRFSNVQVMILRNDNKESVSKNFTAIYTGKISGNKIVDGSVKYSQNGNSWTGTWTASW